ncbi:MAG: preprotein translocase subunit SecY [Acholeplasmatales bacterium]|nr:MAG: preprotein translocase subunit SecY [Acholeplasmatales bacterium]
MDTIKAVFKNKSVMKKIGFTLMIFLVYRLAIFIRMPLINPLQFQELFESGFLGIMDAFTGSALSNFSIIALGIGPYITSSIVVQLLQMDILPVLKEWSEEGETGKRKINQLTRYLAIGLAFVQALGMTYGFQLSSGGGLFAWGEPNFLTFTYLALVITAGTAFLLFLADQITMRGIGNGTSMIIVAGIIAGIPGMFASMTSDYITSDTAGLASYATFGIIIIVYLLVLVGVTFMQSANRKIPIQYSNRPGSSKFKGKQESNIPLKINSAGVIPVIFAVTILSLPQTVINFIPQIQATNFGLLLNEMFNYERPLGLIIYITLIIVFTFFYSFVQINPDKMSNNLQKQNAYIPGIRPGIETENYISKLLFKITVIGSLYLVAVAILPILAAIFFGLPTYVQIGGTSLLIVVGVAIETTKQIKTDVQGKSYSGFIK